MRRLSLYKLKWFVTLGAMLSLGLLSQAAPGAEYHNLGKQQIYGRWHRYPQRPKVWYCYYLHQKPQRPCYDYHYMIWYENQPAYCYLWNPHRKAYVGRWDYSNPDQWRFSVVVNINEGAPPKRLDYGQPAAPPSVPGGEVAMTPPPDLPPVSP